MSLHGAILILCVKVNPTFLVGRPDLCGVTVLHIVKGCYHGLIKMAEELTIGGP